MNRSDGVQAHAASHPHVAHANALPGRPTVLIASTTWWAFPARIAMGCASRGLAVDVICGRGHPLRKAKAVRGHFRYGALWPLATLADAITQSAATLVIPCDDRALMHLQELRGQTQDDTLRRTIDLSLGNPDAYSLTGDRAALAARAIDLGIAAPETLPVEASEDLAGALDRLGLPAVLKVDGTWGGFGVAVVRTRQQAEAGFARLARPISLGKAIKRLLVDRDAFHLLPWLKGHKPRISLQSYVPGRPANSVSACLDGEILGTICAEAIALQRPLGASSVVRIIEHPQMVAAAEKLARSLKLSGVFGLDFLIDEATGQAQLVEMNARATPLCHLAFGAGRDLIGAIAGIAGLQTVAEPYCATDRDVIAYFPQAWHTAPQDARLHTGYHDVPWEDPSLLKELLRRPWPDRGLLATLRRMLLQRRAHTESVLLTNRPMEKT